MVLKSLNREEEELDFMLRPQTSSVSKEAMYLIPLPVLILNREIFDLVILKKMTFTEHN